MGQQQSPHRSSAMTNVKEGPWAKSGPVESGGEPPQDGGMEARVAKLEAAVEYIQRDVVEIKAELRSMNEALRSFGKDVNGELRGLSGDVSTVKERLSHTPTTLQMWVAVAATLVPLGGALWWIVQQYLGPILAKAAGL